MELIVDPVSFIGLVIGLIVESAEPFHGVVVPMSVVKPSVLVVEFSLPMSQSIQLVPFILAAYFEVLYHILRSQACFRDVLWLG